MSNHHLQTLPKTSLVSSITTLVQIPISSFHASCNNPYLNPSVLIPSKEARILFWNGNTFLWYSYPTHSRLNPCPYHDFWCSTMQASACHFPAVSRARSFSPFFDVPHLVLSSGPLQGPLPLLWTLFRKLLKALRITPFRPLLICDLLIDLLTSLSERLFLTWNHPTWPYFSSKHSSTPTYIYLFSGILTIRRDLVFLLYLWIPVTYNGVWCIKGIQ